VGAVQKLATVVIVGLVGLATLLVVYLADEPNRRATEAQVQKDVAIERGINTYITNCVVCHGPAGEGYSEPGAKGTGRIGMPLGGFTKEGLAATARNQPHLFASDFSYIHKIVTETDPEPATKKKAAAAAAADDDGEDDVVHEEAEAGAPRRT